MDAFFEGGIKITEDVDFFKQPKLPDENLYGRCIYLLDSMQVTLPSWLLSKIPYSNEISSSKVLWSPLVTDAYRKGKSYGKGTTEELKEILDALLWSELKNFDERQKFISFLNSLTSGLFNTNEEKSFAEVEGKDIEKFLSGFTPIDNALHGFYQGVFCVAGLPGSGKTSILLNLTACLAQQFPVYYYQTEIPSGLIQSRISLLNPKSFHKDSKFHAGNYSSAKILEEILKFPDKNRIVIYDSPEIKDTYLDDTIYWERTFQELVQIKLHSKAVIVTSQIKQNISWDELGIYSLSGSASKARYLDGLIYLNQFAGNLLIKTAKNRFGILGNSMAKYDYSTMTLEEDYISDIFS